MSEILLLEQNEHDILIKLILLDRWKIKSCGKVRFDKGLVPLEKSHTSLLLVTFQPATIWLVQSATSLPAQV